MPAGPQTLADLRKAGVITSQEVVAAIDLYMRDPAAGLYRFASGYSLDIAALVASSISPTEVANRAGPQEKTFRTAVAAVVMAAHLTAP
ncbi:hypothetical protein SAMN05216360_12943 [Methylobacterium phyllostachyos]|uniref:Uncharacterized protein n=1 Tax=Methylobacterium phyllostachyos TaxID=582672 RepID=A0A1H0KX43_9HYPH|nr:hypothetical protein [Methylobacterium phyllostachyos]SDO60310.1 hypothetical protein SAMN05216360_12943 [Methylobacterium phyllostachyos]